jgi:GNAT superfamily N-acetyltransferase
MSEVRNVMAHRVETAEQVEQMRRIRNLCRETFCHDTREIDVDQQQRWWMENRLRVKAWLYYTRNEHGGSYLGQFTLVGYGMLRLGADGCWWNSIAVLPMYQGWGYGRAITADVARRHTGPVYAEVKRENVPGMLMHRDEDWREISTETADAAMFVTKPHVYAQAEAA